MRVALLIGQLGRGGTEKQLTLLACGLRERGEEVEVLVMYEGGHWEAVLREAGVPVVHLGFRRGPAALPRNVAAFASLVRRLRRARPDVLNTFLIRANVAGVCAGRLARVPVVVTGERALATLTGAAGAAVWLARLADRLADLVVANAAGVAEQVARLRRVPADKITVVYNGLPASAYEPAPPADLGVTAPVVLVVANLHPYKGHRHLLEAMAVLRARGVKCVTALAGDGPERAALERQARSLEVEVRFLGCRADVPALLARADVVVHPGLADGLCNAIMEAMAAGRPLVVTDAGGNRELLDGRGLLVPPEDPGSLAAAVETLLTDRPLAERLGAAARDWSRANLSLDAMVGAYAGLYRRLLRVRGHGPRPALRTSDRSE
ncbi:glycosyltransferase family 4 protein [Sphaerisporangium rubeum]|uniref:Glycosyltransferase involved in cell wall biosynthesis n=1 Tax=Sphaerisporangium rubeum TaxID=321317 RepID=A0A7X0ID57_9ACTN|nr:glycosyltransferase [Sphaerisporangium rubeum]MBB6472966.1 glycosyltransferase involved in cell wall biosynthesis [Sphaerisporangium rubeum]